MNFMFFLGTSINCSTSASLCQNGGTCVNKRNLAENELMGIKCQCRAGYSGDFCEKG
jgi:hypothetical protein